MISIYRCHWQFPKTLAVATYLSFGFSRLGVTTADIDLYFYDMAFVLRSDAFPASNLLFEGKTGAPVFYIKVGGSR